MTKQNSLIPTHANLAARKFTFNENDLANQTFEPIKVKSDNKLNKQSNDSQNIKQEMSFFMNNRPITPILQFKDVYSPPIDKVQLKNDTPDP